MVHFPFWLQEAQPESTPLISQVTFFAWQTPVFEHIPTEHPISAFVSWQDAFWLGTFQPFKH